MTRVLDTVKRLFAQRYACDPDEVELPATLDDLNLAPHEREEMVGILAELYHADVSGDEADTFETVEDVVGWIEDQLIERRNNGEF